MQADYRKPMDKLTDAPANCPHVTVSLNARGKPHPEVLHGRAVVCILDP